MKKLLSAGLLAVIAHFMLVGFFESDASLGDPATVTALTLVVGLPAVGAGVLLWSYFADRRRNGGRRAQLRRQTIEAEVLRLAGAQDGRLTAVEVARELTLPAEEAKESLDSLVTRGHADLAVTDEGVLVYTFHDVRHLGGKSSARNILDA